MKSKLAEATECMLTYMAEETIGLREKNIMSIVLDILYYNGQPLTTMINDLSFESK